MNAYQCDRCGVRFGKPYSLKRHIRRRDNCKSSQFTPVPLEVGAMLEKLINAHGYANIKAIMIQYKSFMGYYSLLPTFIEYLTSIVFKENRADNVLTIAASTPLSPEPGVVLRAPEDTSSIDYFMGRPLDEFTDFDPVDVGVVAEWQDGTTEGAKQIYLCPLLGAKCPFMPRSGFRNCTKVKCVIECHCYP